MSSKDDKYPEPIDETPKSSLEVSTSTSHDEKLLEEAVSENLDWLIVLNIYLVCHFCTIHKYLNVIKYMCLDLCSWRGINY